MGKKITLDFSKVEERSGWNSKEMPEGLHEFKIELVDLKDAGDGTTMWTYGLRPTNPKYKTRLFPYYCKHQQNQLFKLRDIFVAAGLSVPKKKQALDPEAPVGKIIAAELTDATGNYAGRSEVDGVYTTDILDGDEGASDVDDEEYEDEEYDEDDEADVDEEDDEEVDDEELREEIEALTLAELRKRAKVLDIDTDGVKKADLVELVIEEELGLEDEDEDDEDDLDDDDLDDEDLEDEEFEDDEDEEDEEPVKPARKTASKPAAKAPAKKAAAPAKRVVRRR